MPSAEVLFVWGGSGANVLSLATMVGPAQAVVCTESAHINVDETGAPERFVGAKLIDVPTVDGKLRPEHVEAVTHALGNEHHVQPGVVSITQSTELGTLYTVDEVQALGEVAHRYGMTLHMDGARIANAAVALGADVRSFTVDAGVDVLSFGGTKNGMMYGEAVVYLSPELARSARFVRKQVTQLPSKMRFVAAQFTALLRDGLWLRNAAHANGMATRLYDVVHDQDGVDLGGPPARQQPVPAPAEGGHRAAAGLVTVLRLGSRQPAGAVDDQLRHDGRGCHPLRRGCEGSAVLRSCPTRSSPIAGSPSCTTSSMQIDPISTSTRTSSTSWMHDASSTSVVERVRWPACSPVAASR